MKAAAWGMIQCWHAMRQPFNEKKGTSVVSVLEGKKELNQENKVQIQM